MKRKVVITGAQGQLGKRVMALATEFEARLEVVGLSRKDCDVCDADAVRAALAKHRPDVVIHAAAFTGVDASEDKANQAMRVNSDGTRNVAEAAREVGADLVYISTDYVFDGTSNRPYRADEKAAPIGVYGLSKRAGEEAVLACSDRNHRTWVIRLAWLVDGDPLASNFLTTMVRLASENRSIRVVNDQHGVPTGAPPLARFLLRLAAGDHPNVPDGIHHYGHAGETTWFGLAQALFTGLGIDADLSPCTTADFPTKAKRPQYSVLDPVPLHEFIGEEPLHWTEALEMCMEHLKTN